ncbi:SDR family oxidoreductase [Sphingopyxis panaciterrae]
MSKSVAIVTGASSGIGKSTALRLARDFTSIALIARSGEKLELTAEEVIAAGAEPLAIEIDLGAPDAADKVIASTIARFGRIDAVVNIAGAVPGIDLFQMTDAGWENAMAVKFHGARRLTLAAWEALKESGGSVIFISGTGAETPNAGTAAIGTINAAIEALAKSFADRGLKDGVQVNSVSPGPVMTDRRRALIKAAADANGLSVAEGEARFLAQSGISRFGRPEDIAELVAYAVSPPARWMTGTVLRIDGGETKSI